MDCKDYLYSTFNLNSIYLMAQGFFPCFRFYLPQIEDIKEMKLGKKIRRPVDFIVQFSSSFTEIRSFRERKYADVNLSSNAADWCLLAHNEIQLLLLMIEMQSNYKKVKWWNESQNRITSLYLIHQTFKSDGFFCERKFKIWVYSFSINKYHKSHKLWIEDN